MKTILLLVTLLLSGCVTTSYEKDGTKITYTDWFKKANDVNIQWDGITIQIGGISSEITAEDIAAYLKVKAAMPVE